VVPWIPCWRRIVPYQNASAIEMMQNNSTFAPDAARNRINYIRILLLENSCVPPPAGVGFQAVTALR
jgi:hypothetical protein